jgi:dihydropteroate synthase type 2
MTVSLLGILNITEDSFSDGGRYLAADAAVAHGEALVADGADIIDLGAASSNPDAKPVAAEVEIARLAPVVDALKRAHVALSVDSFALPVQRWALSRDIDYLNDIHGFPHPELYDDLARARCKLIVMHAVQNEGRAERLTVDPGEIFDRILRFFEQRIAALVAAGIARSRLILDPGMGFFLGTEAEASYEVLRRLPALKEAFSLPLLVSVSRKSFLRRSTGRPPRQAGAASLSAELFAVGQGADYIRTHDPGALRDGLRVRTALLGGQP